MTEASFNDWTKLQLKVAEITKVEQHPNADKLYVLTLDVGEEEPRTIVSSLKDYYNSEELLGKKIVVFCNLEAKPLRGITSHGMLLAAEQDNDCVLLTVDKDIPNGARIT